MEIFDISQTLANGMPVWPGDPEFQLRPALRIAEGGASNVSEVRMGTHTGTHIDAPFHVNDEGVDVTRIPIESLIGPVRVIRYSGTVCIRAADLSPLDWQGVERVLFHTRSANKPEDSFDSKFIYLNEDAAEFLAERGLLFVGTDAPSVDAFGSTDLTSHKVLLQRGTAVLENARLEGIAPGDYSLICLPLKLAGADGSPVRAILWR